MALSFQSAGASLEPVERMFQGPVTTGNEIKLPSKQAFREDFSQAR
jgi:hypothetical protein